MLFTQIFLRGLIREGFFFFFFSNLRKHESLNNLFLEMLSQRNFKKILNSLLFLFLENFELQSAI